MEIVSSEIDGVPVLWREGPGPLSACLRFGVGHNDELLAQSGISHAVEHLCLRPVGRQAYEWNGTVDTLSTSFFVKGTPDEVAGFLGQVCRNLNDLPTTDLRHELQVMRVEAQRRSPTHLATDLGIRYGASGPGLLDWSEFGLQHLPAVELQKWANRWFSAANAVLWLNGPYPDDLRFPLPDSPVPPRREIATVASDGRIWVPRKTSLVSLSILAGKTMGRGVAMQIARQRIFDQLRTALAISYDVALVSELVAPDCSLHQIVADGGAGDAETILSTLIREVEQLAESGPTVDELELYRIRWRRGVEEPSGHVAWMHRMAGRLLYGLPLLDIDEERVRLDRLTSDDVARTTSEGLDGAIAIGPERMGGALPGWKEQDRWSMTTIAGMSLAADSRFTTGTMVTGDDGISWVRNALQRRTVRWEDVSACLVWNDGSRTVIGTDGMSVVVHPWEWVTEDSSQPDALTQLIDARCDPDVRVLMGPGSGPPRQDETKGAQSKLQLPEAAEGRAPQVQRPKPAWRTFVRPYQLVLLIGCFVVIVIAVGAARGLASMAVVIVGAFVTTRILMRSRQRR